MNKVILMGRLTRDPEVRYSQGENALAIARYTLAVDRRFNRNNSDEQTADFINCVALDVQVNLQRSISEREPRLLLPVVSRQAAIPTRMVSESTRQRLW